MLAEGRLLRVGSSVGWLTGRDIEDWKREVVVVQKRHLTEDARVALGLGGPEAEIDASRFPHVAAAARACPVIACDADAQALLAAQGVPCLVIQWHRGAGGGLIASRSGGDSLVGINDLHHYGLEPLDEAEARAIAELRNRSVPEPDFEELVAEDVQALVAGRREGLVEPDFVAPTVDRVLRVLSEGRVSDAAVLLATELADACADDAWQARWNGWLAEVFRRAEPTATRVHALAARLAAEPRGDFDEPELGRVRRVVLPTVTLGAASDPATLRLPKEVVYVIDGASTSSLPPSPRPGRR